MVNKLFIEVCIWYDDIFGIIIELILNGLEMISN
jgi:hypothetical protein